MLKRLSHADRIALLLSLLAVVASYLVTERVFEGLPHIEDEMAYVWQAQAIAGGRLTLPSPPDPKSFLVPFVVDYNGQRFGKYPPGWPALLALGMALHLRSLVNPLLAGLGVWFTYRLGKRVSSEIVGLLAAGLTVSSPFFLMNSGSLLSHPLGLVLSEAFALTWLDAWDVKVTKPWLPTIASALSLGLLVLTRPLTAVAVCLPFAFHGVYLMIKGSREVRRRLLAFAGIVLAESALYFAWQFAVTGNALLNPYTLWWPYDKIGFGPGFGNTASGHNFTHAEINTTFSLWVGYFDLFGWGQYSWIFLPFGLFAAYRQRLDKMILLGCVFASLVIVYMAYWIGSSLFGPRYFYEGLYSLTLLSGLGIAYLAGWPVRSGQSWRSFTGWKRIRPLLVTVAVLLLISTNLFFYAPIRLSGMHGLYGVTRSRLEPFFTEQAQKLTPALVIVHPDLWTEYGTLLELENPWLNTPFIFAMSMGPAADAALTADFPQRNIYHYYPSQPNKFYAQPLNPVPTPGASGGAR
jgi:hypothetical protein